ncbi:DUF2865 domain-containing protein [Pseudoxanthobacter sp. M-2]|uniref:DUF2865 domain-containing protein n=1 Tax=Pseudoxanthobacter sp. M-2 TaxID=3078754 RepID=UPI0038FC263D
MWKTGSVLVAATVAGFLLTAGPVRAQSCADLQSQLNAVSGGGGGNLAAARKRLATLQRQSKANGCQGSNSMGRPRACAGIDSTIRTVSGQIAAIEARGGAGDQNRRKRIQAQMAKQKCGQAAPARQQQARPAAPAPAQAAPERSGGRPDYVVQNNRIVSTKRTEGGGLLSLLFGGGRAADPRGLAAAGTEATTVRLQPGAATTGRTGERPATETDGKVTYARHFFGGGSYRTLCVRSCDGYYFPISTVTTRGNFARDDAVCQSLCPQAALYAHSSGSESENMYRVADGRSYKELETAFVYRKTYNPSCSCTFEAKMIVTADGQELIDVEGSRAAYSPAITSDAAAAIDGLTIAGGVGSEITAVVAEPAIIEGDASDLPAAIDASAAGPAALIKITTTASPSPAAVLSEAQPTADPIAATAVHSDDAAAEVLFTPAASTATAPRGAPIPASTPEPLRVRTIGPEFLQSP